MKIMKIILIFVITFSIHNLQAQEEQQPPLFDPQQKNYQSSLEKYYKDRSIIRPTVTQVLESELEAKNYIVGPGDLFKVNIFGQIESEFNFQILPEGKIVIPTIGEIEVGNLRLSEAKQKITAQIEEFYIKSHISVNLVGLRRFRVYLTGEVRNPGTYFAQGSDRISDIIEIGDGITDWADDTEVEIRGSDGTKKYVDLNNFYLEGDLTQNPFVRGGDLIHINSIDIRERYVIVEGNAEISSRLEEKRGSGRSNLFGVYPIKSDEALYNFLKRIGALSRKSNLEAIVLRRDSIEYKINLLEANNDYLSFKLNHKDRIYIPPLIDRVYVKGQVLNPGAYPYYANYLAKDYVGNAGALETAVDLEDYIVIRRKTGEQLKGGEILIEKGDIIIVDKSGGESLKDFLIIFTPMLSLVVTVLLLIQGSK